MVIETDVLDCFDPVIQDPPSLLEPVEESPEESKQIPSSLYTYFGSKKKVVKEVWQHLDGDGYSKYIEPFAGTAVVALTAPESINNIFLNDFDCHIANVLRSVLYYPEEVVENACRPRLELDLHMIHDYLQTSEGVLKELLMSGIEQCDPVKAGWWVWGCNNWLGGGWGTDHGKQKNLDALALKNKDLWRFEEQHRTSRSKPNSRNSVTERVVQSTFRRKLNHGNSVTERVVQSTRRKKLSNGNRNTERVTSYPRKDYIRSMVFRAYTRLRDAKILYGDFERVLTNSYTQGKCSIFLDPPYPNSNDQVYMNLGNNPFKRSLDFFLANYQAKDKRIIFCCQDSDLEGCSIPVDIRRKSWSRDAGYGSGAGSDSDSRARRTTEVILLSNACK